MSAINAQKAVKAKCVLSCMITNNDALNCILYVHIRSTPERTVANVLLISHPFAVKAIEANVSL